MKWKALYFAHCLETLVILLFFCFTFMGSAVAQEEILAPPTATWDNISYMGNVKSIVISQDGKMLWEGTSGGLKLRDIQTGEVLKVFTSSNGLPENHMESLLPDGSGGLWIGTLGGLAHFDGDQTWNYFNQSNSDLPSDSIGKHSNALVYDETGCIWIATAGGLAYFDLMDHWQVFNNENSDLPENNIQMLMFDENTGLWVGTWGGGLAHYGKDGQWEIFNTQNSPLPGNQINSILSDGNHGVWVGARNEKGQGGLAHLDGQGSWELYTPYNSSLSGTYVRALLADGDGGVWIGMYDDTGLVHLQANGTCQIFNKLNSDLPTNTINTLVSDGSGGMWIGTWEEGSMDGGLVHYDGLKEWRHFNDKDNWELPDNYVYKMLSDNNEGIWMGTENGLAHYDKENQWTIFNSNDLGLQDKAVEILVMDDQGGFWVGSYGEGIAHCSSQLHCTGVETVIPYVSTIMADLQGGFWVGGIYSGLDHYNENGQNDIILTQGNSNLPGNRIRSLENDGLGGIWIGSDGGLAHYTGSFDMEVYQIHNSEMPSNMVTALLADPNGGIWVGTDNGIVHFDGIQTWTSLQPLNSDVSPVKVVYHILPDGANGFWMGGAGDDYWSSPQGEDKQTLTGGTFAHYDGANRWMIFNRENSGIPPTVVFSFAPDGSGGFWLGTLSGVAHLSLLGSLEQVFPDKSDIHLSWFLNRTLLEQHQVLYIELQRALAKNSPYETVMATDNTPLCFHVDYTNCPDPRTGDCWPEVEGHTPATKGSGDNLTKGYTLDTPVIDPEWLEGVPRYYRLSAVIEKDGELVRAANNQEAILITPTVKERPRAKVILERSAIALTPGDEIDISVFVSSLDLFSGEVELQIENLENIEAEFDSNTINLTPGSTDSTVLHIKIPENISDDTEINIKIKPVTPSSDFESQAADLKIQIGTVPLITLGVIQDTQFRVMDGINVSGNITPPEADQEVVVTGNNIEDTIFTTDADGYFEGAVIATKSGELSITARSSNSVSEPVTISILPAKTHITLSSNVDQNTSKGDTLSIQGIISPIRLSETKVSLDIRYLDTSNIDGDLIPQFVGDIRIDSKGEFSKDIVVLGDGFIYVKAVISETSDFIAVNTKLTIPIGQPVGEGILVVSESGSNEFKEISKTLGSQVYNTLLNRNIPPDRIQYLGLAENNIETKGSANKNDLKYALTSWAVSMMSKDDPYKTPLNLYLIGTVQNNEFSLNSQESLTAQELGEYLDEAEQAIKAQSECSGFPVTIVLEGSQTGAWIETIAGQGRIILTSSSDESLSQGGYAGYGADGQYSFSRYFYQYINYGSDIDGSFAEANYEILKFYKHTQRPEMDADGDGKATTEFDRYAAIDKFIEYRPSGNLRPEIRAVNMAKTVKGAVKGGLWARVIDPENDIKGVFCSITDPVGETVNVELINTTGEMYKACFEEYYHKGNYQLIYYAQDNFGNISLPKERFVNVVEPVSDLAKVKVEINNSSFQAGEQLKFDIVLNSSEVADLYVVLIVPQGFFFSITHPLVFNPLNKLSPYKEQIELSGEQDFNILDLTIPDGLSPGSYLCYGVLTLPGSDPLNIENWISYDFKEFLLN